MKELRRKQNTTIINIENEFEIDCVGDDNDV